MSATSYENLVSLLIDDDMSPEQEQTLLAMIREDPQKLKNIAAHLMLWEVYAQRVSPFKQADHFVDSLDTRVKATRDSDRFMCELEQKINRDSLLSQSCALPLESTYESDEQRIDQIERIARERLRDFLAHEEQARVPFVRSRRSLPNLRVPLQRALVTLSDWIGSGVRAVQIAAVGTTVVLVLTVMGIRTLQNHGVVAILADSVHAQWEVPPAHAELRRGPLHLQEGFARLAFKHGDEAILQAPCVVSLESPKSLFLQSGTLVVKVADGKTGFVVRTPYSTVEDFGTEFGVIVRLNGETEAYVHEGIVSLTNDLQPYTPISTKMLGQGQAMGVDAEGQFMEKTYQPTQFVRTIDRGTGWGIPGKTLDLADVVGGGNGYGTGSPNRGIHTLTGRPFTVELHDFNNIEPLKHHFVMTPSLPFVDGVFVPDGRLGAIQVSSAGDFFDACPATVGKSHSHVYNGARFYNRSQGYHYFRLNGVEYGPGRPAICIHANQGISFDLEAIRQSMPGMVIDQFKSICGVSETVLDDKMTAVVDFWVLVDGEQRFSRRVSSGFGGGVTVDVKLDRQDRFLTLITTDAGDEIVPGQDDSMGYDWALFAEPSLILKPVSN
jgi:hypothetical protein